MNYGYKDSSELGKQGGKFGLNKGAFLTKFEFNPNAGKDGAEQDALETTVQIGDREYRSWYYPINKAFSKKGGGEITDTSSPEYKQSMEEQFTQLSATLSDFVKCFVEEEVLKQALATPIASFRDYAMILQRLVQSTPNWDKRPLDVFLQYQYNVKEGKDRTFLEIPTNVKHGTFICKSVEGTFVENRTSSHLRYITSEGVYHPFKRGEWFVSSPFANLTSFAKDDNTNVGMSGNQNVSENQVNW